MEGNVIELSSDSSAPPSPKVADSSNFPDLPTVPPTEHTPPDDDDDDLLSISDVEEALGITPPQKQVHCISDSEESVVAVECEESTADGEGRGQPCKMTARKRPRAQSLNKTTRRQCRDEERQQREEQRQQREEQRQQREEQRQEQRRQREEQRRQRAMALQLERARKAVAAKQARAMKPGECHKYICVQLDSVLLTEVYGGELLVALQGAELNYKIQAMAMPRLISWTRSIPGHALGTGLEEYESENLEVEDEVLLVQPWSEVVQLVHSGELCTRVHALKTVIPGQKLTLIIYGMDQYFRYQKARRNKEFRGRVLGSDRASSKGGASKEPSLETAPVISHEQLEEALAEVQLFANCCHRLVESPSALGALVAQFTKAVAEKPYKLEKRRKEEEKFDWFAVADSKDCVRVDKHGNGLLRLWKQQLCQFNLATLETAEAIASKYQSPQALLQAYNQCTSQRSAELLLQDVPIRRALGPLTSMRRVGPELSKKIHRFFTAEKGDILLSQE